MSWKTALQLSDLSPPERIEMICSGCGHVTKIHPGDPMIGLYGHLYLDELESRARCRRAALKGTAGGCGTTMRLLLCSDGEAHAFQAGIA
ncbi:hypothetical protein [uncultured Algimonas sp.]|uniref:hypothetical protein n=1 Tax=uncultured Algimonas sp. TaxID=1547920 RepID=UPI002621D773|nr:hypothetical protein [uncultured Algimonas sp.]